MLGNILTIFFLATFVQSQVLMDGSCPVVPVMKSFSPEKFLGTWYEIERYYSDFQVNTKCNKIDFTHNPDGRIGILTTAIHEKSGMPKVAYGLANFEYGESARMTIRITPSPGAPALNEFGYWVLDTDYESYAVVYSCDDFCRGRQHAQSIWVLGRTAIIPQQVSNRIYDKIKVLGLDPKRLIKVDQHKCVNVAVSVRTLNSAPLSAMSSAPVIPTSSQYGLAIVDETNNPHGHESAGALTLQESQLGGEKTDFDHVHNRFKVVKIVSTEPFRKGRWMCMDYFDQTMTSTGGASSSSNQTHKDTGSPQSHQHSVPVTPQPQQPSNQGIGQNMQQQQQQQQVNAQANQTRGNVPVQQQPQTQLPQQSWTIQPQQQQSQINQSQGVTMPNTSTPNQNWILSGIIRQNPGMMPQNSIQQQPGIQQIQQSPYPQQSQSNIYPQQNMPSSIHQTGFSTPTQQTQQSMQSQQSSLPQSGVSSAPQQPQSQLISQNPQGQQITNMNAIPSGQVPQNTQSQQPTQSQPASASVMIQNQQPLYPQSVQPMNQQNPQTMNTVISIPNPASAVGQPLSSVSSSLISENTAKILDDQINSVVPGNEPAQTGEDSERDNPGGVRRDVVMGGMNQPAVIQQMSQPSYPSQQSQSNMFSQQNMPSSMQQIPNNIQQPPNNLQQQHSIHPSGYSTPTPQQQPMQMNQQSNISQHGISTPQQTQMMSPNPQGQQANNMNTLPPGQIPQNQQPHPQSQQGSAPILIQNQQQPSYQAPAQSMNQTSQNINAVSSIPNTTNVSVSQPVSSVSANLIEPIGKTEDQPGLNAPGNENTGISEDMERDSSAACRRDVLASSMPQQPLQIQQPNYQQQTSSPMFNTQNMTGNIQQTPNLHQSNYQNPAPQQQQPPMQVHQQTPQPQTGLSNAPQQVQAQPITQNSQVPQTANMNPVSAPQIPHSLSSQTPQSLPAPILMQSQKQQPLYPAPAQSMTQPATQSMNTISSIPNTINSTVSQHISSVSGNSIAEAIVKGVLEDQNAGTGHNNDSASTNDDPESASGTNTVAIDNKIEQAMDLVKSHLMFAVREEVEVLKEKIAELMDRISQLEYENTILKANASQETLAQIQSKTNQMHGTGGGGGNTTSLNNNS